MDRMDRMDRTDPQGQLAGCVALHDRYFAATVSVLSTGSRRLSTGSRPRGRYRFLGHEVMPGITTTGTDFLPLAVAFSPDEK